MSNTKKLKTKEKKMAYDWYIAKSVVRAKGFSYGQLAEKLGVSVTTIHDICNFPPNVVRVKQLAPPHPLHLVSHVPTAANLSSSPLPQNNVPYVAIPSQPKLRHT